MLIPMRTLLRLCAAAAPFLAGCATPEFERMSRLERDVQLAHVRHSPESQMSLWLARTDGSEILSIQADRRVPGASTLKVLLLVEAHAQALDGTLDLGASTTYLEEDRIGGSGSLQYEKPGSTWTWRQLIRRMIAESDNAASNMLLKRLGVKNVNARAERLGMEVTRFERLFMDEGARHEGHENWTTAREMGHLLRSIFRREILTPGACDEMIQTLEKTSRGRIAAGVPKFIPVGHKGGALPGLRHDVGWVRVPGHPYLLSIFLDNVLEKRASDEDRGFEAIEAISRVVYNALGPTEE
jgi:beta-lactamase class A